MTDPRSIPPVIRRPRVVLAAALAAAACALAGCSTSPGPSAAAAGKPVRGGTLKVALGPGITCLDPQQTISLDARSATRGIAESLTDLDPNTGKIVPWLAKSWQVNADATRYTFHLATGLTFSDGTPFTARTVQKNLDYIKDTLGGKALRGAGYLKNYTGTEVVDDHTAVVRFSRPSIQFLGGTATPAFAMLAESSVQATPEDRCQGSLVGTGPFTLAGYRQNQSIKLTRRKGYVASSALARHKGEPYLDGISFRIMPVSNVRSGALGSGQVDVASAVASQDTQALTARGYRVKAAVQPGLPGSFFVNVTRPQFKDPAVRQALQISLNRASLVKAVLGARFKPATSVLSSTTPGYRNLSRSLTPDPRMAASLLDAAGWARGPDGVRAKNGTKLSMTVVYSSEIGDYYTSLLQLVQRQWKDIGVSVELKDITQASLAADLADGDYDLWISSLTEAEPDVLRTFVGGYHPGQRELRASGITGLFDTEQAAAQPGERARVFGRIQQKMIDGALVIPLFESAQLMGASRKVGGLRFEAGAFLSYYDAWIQR
ncbi:ABC transporter substrate-binding protein [Streptomyces umbrinus]|uniref:ABC transporter substrate-binding protein n=1 Tax=Streptomyces umbrinus TaxID=67370 RepID=UPI003C2CE08C